MFSDFKKKGAIFLLGIFFLFLSGCSTRYIAEYDAKIKEEIVHIAKNVDLFWGALLDVELSKRQYDKFKIKYNKIESDIRGLAMKNAIREFNKESTAQTKIVLDLWVEDRATHKKQNTISTFIAKRHRSQYTKSFTAMAKGEEIKNTSASDEDAISTGGSQ